MNQLIASPILPAARESESSHDRPLAFATELVHFDPCPGDPWRPASTPIYQTATFELPSATEAGAYDYSRSGNPTRSVLEAQLARLERGAGALAFASGMAAIANVIRLLKAGDELVAGLDLYGGTFRLLGQVLPAFGIGVRCVDTRDLDAVAAALGAGARLLLAETPSNPRLEISDLASLAAAAHDAGAMLVVDNSLMSPYLQSPLELGADVVVHSATKFLGGHSDLSAGVVVVRDAALLERLRWFQNAEGTALGPFDAWLLLRGLETLALRVDRQQAAARRIAAALGRHEAVRAVHWPGLDAHAGAALHARQARGPGAVISFETGDTLVSEAMVDACRLFKRTVSFGGVHSTISLPCRMSHASIPPALRARSTPPPDLVRLSAGIEDPEDLVGDLVRALDTASTGG